MRDVEQLRNCGRAGCGLCVLGNTVPSRSRIRVQYTVYRIVWIVEIIEYN